MSPRTRLRASVLVMLLSLVLRPTTFDSILLSAIASANESETVTERTQRLVIDLFRTEGRSLVRLARLFVDDRDAAEDIVQEAFLRLARSATRIQDESKAPAYLRSIVLNLARDHNRRGLVSLRHHATAGHEVDVGPLVEDELVRDQQHRAVLDAVRSLPTRQRDCVTLRYFEELGIDAIAAVLRVSPNSVKTHLRRGMAALGQALEAEHDRA
jgi:RNA polymerase sigma factor (sigma-70 family)